jgi:tetratricopeptide (TPR) repeat protein
VAVSTGKTWTDIATAFDGIVNAQIGMAAISTLVSDVIQGARGREEKIERILTIVLKNVRYTGVEFGEASLIPVAPTETLKRKYGDCKDQSTLLVAMLRSAGIQAHIALLKTWPSQEIEQDLPGMGAFNHAIVFIPGESPLWIDPSAGWARLGNLPASDQGRLALVIASDTSKLVLTPVSSSTDNRTIETRKVILAEEGTATVIETTETWGLADTNLRQSYESVEADTLTEVFKPYAQGAYMAEAVAKVELSNPEDITVPFRLQLEITGVESAMTDETAAAIAIDPINLFEPLPFHFWVYEEESEQSEDVTQTESEYKADDDMDTVLEQPYVTEWRYQIIPPPGYVPDPLPANEVLSLGPARLSKEFSENDEGVVSATLRFDTVKRRMTAEDVKGLRAGIRQLEEADPVLITFEQTGHAHLAAGRIREALAEFRRLERSYPGKAIYAAQTAQALLAAGLGEAAQMEAKRAVELDPESASAYRALGWILQHDAIGRRFGRGSDYEGAVEAYRKTLELNPEDLLTRMNLAILLEHDAKGNRYGKHAKLEEAIKEYEPLLEEIDTASQEYNNYPIALLMAERFEDLFEFAEKNEGMNTMITALKLAAIAVTKGSEAAIDEARKNSLSIEEQCETLQSAGFMLTQIRRYPEAGALLTAGAIGAENSAEILSRASIFESLRRREDLPPPAKDPRNIIMQFFSNLMLEENAPEFISLFAREANISDAENEIEEFYRVRRVILARFRRLNINPESIADMMIPLLQMSLEGEDSFGYRIRAQVPFTAEDMVFFLLQEDGEYRLLSAGDEPTGIGAVALRLVENGDVAAARRWLDWAREEAPLPGGDDPYAGIPFSRLWNRGSKASPEEIRLAAASLMAMSEHRAEQSLPILIQDREKADSPDVRSYIDMALCWAYGMLGQYEKLLPITEKLLESTPASETLFNNMVRTLMELDRFDEAERIANERLEMLPGDRAAFRFLVDIAESGGDFQKAIAIIEQMMQLGKAEVQDLNEYAWISLFMEELEEKAVEAGRRAVLLSNSRNAATLHTLASIYAGLGRTSEARELILNSLEVAGREIPASHDWYVFGRIAEQYGEKEAAVRAYNKVEAPSDNELLSTYELAQKRLKFLNTF